MEGQTYICGEYVARTSVRHALESLNDGRTHTLLNEGFENLVVEQLINDGFRKKADDTLKYEAENFEVVYNPFSSNIFTVTLDEVNETVLKARDFLWHISGGIGLVVDPIEDI